MVKSSPFETLFIKVLSSEKLLTGAEKIPNHLFSREIVNYSKPFGVFGWPEYVEDYHVERPHQAIGNRPLIGTREAPSS
jgi:hypothetical protein